VFDPDHCTGAAVDLLLRDLRDRLREKSIIISKARVLCGQVFQVGNIGELSDYEHSLFLGRAQRRYCWRCQAGSG